MSIIDAAQRARAIDPHTSFCISAPAGSGKTELLIQRYLQLLSRVERPEQVLAITFTRKAAAEMQERVVDALQAAKRGEPCHGEHQPITRDLAEQALAEQPDAIQIISSAIDAALLIQQIRKIDPDLPLSTSEWAATEKLIDLGGGAVEGVVMAQFFNRDSSLARYQDFKRAFEARFSQPPGFAEVAGYDAAAAPNPEITAGSGAGNAQLDIPANVVWAMVFEATLQ